MSSSDPSSPSPVEKLIRLKRFEKPEPGFEAAFLEAFKDRQRAELLKQSVFGVIRERVQMFWENLSGPRWALPGAAAAVLLLMLSLVSHYALRVDDGGQMMAEIPEGGYEVDAVWILGEDLDEPVRAESPMYLSKHFDGGYADDARRAQAQLSREIKDGALGVVRQKTD
jgi:hypothetical protein